MSLYSQILADAPIAYWPQDEAAGASSAVDRSGNGVTGTYNGVTPGAAGLGWKAADYDGVNDYLSFTGQSVPAAASSLEIWFLTDNIGVQQALFGNSGDGDVYVYLFSATRVDVQCDSPGLASFTVPTITAGIWHQLVVTRSANTTRLYLDGVESSTGGVTQTSAMTVNQLGRYLNGSSGLWFDGRLAHAAVFPTALTAARITAHYQAGIRSAVLGGYGTIGGSAVGFASIGGGQTGTVSTPPPAGPSGTAALVLSATATGSIRPAAGGLAALVLSATASGGGFAPGTAVVGDASEAATLRLSARASGSVEVPVVAAPAGVTEVPIKRTRLTMPAPVLVDGRPS